MSPRVKKYRKKPVVIEAVRYYAPSPDWEGNVQAIEDFGAEIEPTEHWSNPGHPRSLNLRLFVAANNDWLEIEPGSWIIRDASGFYPCLNERFAETYEPAE